MWTVCGQATAGCPHLPTRVGQGRRAVPCDMDRIPTVTGLLARRRSATAAEALTRMARVRHVEIRVRAGRAATPGREMHALTGNAVVDAIRAGNRITWLEAGGWGTLEPFLRPTPREAPDAVGASPDLDGIRFRNELRWTQLGSALLQLERPRPGPARETRIANALDGNHAPVRILLVPDATGAWVSASAHVCGHDLYTARLELREDGMTLVWIVRGPKKDQLIVCTYAP